MAAGITILTAALLLTPGCVKNTTTAPPCDGFNGGNIVGKWKFRFLVPDAEIQEYRADGTHRQEFMGTDPREGTYEVDGNLVRGTSGTLTLSVRCAFFVPLVSF